MKKVFFLLFLFGGISCNPKQDNSHQAEPAGQPVFERISSQFSGITFNNKITENVETQENLFDFDYFYNGAGLGVADLNNDGLPDIFFCGHHVARLGKHIYPAIHHD